MDVRLSGTGVWSYEMRYGDPSAAAAAASELETLGYTALWIPDAGGDLFASVANLLEATTTATIATGILNLWLHTPQQTAVQHADLTKVYGDRFLVGIGVSHAPIVDSKQAGTYRKPYSAMVDYLDALDAADPPLAVENRALAALGPKMLALAAERTAGAHPYLGTPEHTGITRETVGPDALVLPEQAVVLDTDPTSARAIARAHLEPYLVLPNYVNNWKRLGFSADDAADGGSDALVDALVVWGDETTIAKRIQQHRDAGADHVCIQALGPTPGQIPMDTLRTLAPVLNKA